MLKIIRSFGELDLVQLCNIYEQSLLENSLKNYADETALLALLYEQQSFYDFLRCFLSERDNLYAVWIEDNTYSSALRLERYRDGYLLTGLETAVHRRGKGSASRLMQSFLRFCEYQMLLPIYSHIKNVNEASITIHAKCGFMKVFDCASYLDGSVDHRSKTYRYSGE